MSQRFLGCRQMRAIDAVRVQAGAAPWERALRAPARHPSSPPSCPPSCPAGSGAAPQLPTPPPLRGLRGAGGNGVTCLELRMSFFWRVWFGAGIFRQMARSPFQGPRWGLSRPSSARSSPIKFSLSLLRMRRKASFNCRAFPVKPP